MRIHFPRMHPALDPGPEVPGALRFDPGYTAEPPEGAYRPENLPLAPAAARRLVADAVAYGEQFRNPGEMAWHGLNADTGGSETESAIRAELMARVRGSGPEQPVDSAVAQAQFVLLLAWHLEERLAELAGLEAGLWTGRERFDASLGLGEGEAAGEFPLGPSVSDSALSGPAPGQESEGFAWRPALEAMCRLLPGDAELVVSDPVVLAAWEEAGVAFEPAGDEDLPPGTRRAEASLGRLAGRRGAGAGLLARLVSVLAVPKRGEGA